MENKKKNPRNVSSIEAQPDGTIKVTMHNTPLVKNSTKSQKSAIRPTNSAGKLQKLTTNRQQHTEQVEFFDATIDYDDTPSRDIAREVEEAKNRALKEHKMLENYRNNPPKKDKTFSSSVIASIVSVAILLALTLVFFLWLKWYPVGLAFAIITIITIQVWISFLKRINKKYDALEGVSDQDEKDLQNHLREKYPNLYATEQTEKTTATDTPTSSPKVEVDSNAKNEVKTPKTD